MISSSPCQQVAQQEATTVPLEEQEAQSQALQPLPLLPPALPQPAEREEQPEVLLVQEAPREVPQEREVQEAQKEEPREASEDSWPTTDRHLAGFIPSLLC